MQFSNDKFTEIYKTINNKESKKKYQISIVLSPRKLPKREKGTIPISWTIQRSRKTYSWITKKNIGS